MIVVGPEGDCSNWLTLLRYLCQKLAKLNKQIHLINLVVDNFHIYTVSSKHESTVITKFHHGTLPVLLIGLESPAIW